MTYNNHDNQNLPPSTPPNNYPIFSPTTPTNPSTQIPNHDFFISIFPTRPSTNPTSPCIQLFFVFFSTVTPIQVLHNHCLSPPSSVDEVRRECLGAKFVNLCVFTCSFETHVVSTSNLIRRIRVSGSYTHLNTSPLLSAGGHIDSHRFIAPWRRCNSSFYTTKKEHSDLFIHMWWYSYLRWSIYTLEFTITLGEVTELMASDCTRLVVSVSEKRNRMCDFRMTSLSVWEDMCLSNAWGSMWVMPAATTHSRGGSTTVWRTGDSHRRRGAGREGVSEPSSALIMLSFCRSSQI